MGKLAKKSIIYLDQNFISNIAKSSIKSGIAQEYNQIFDLLHKGFIDEKMIVPRSIFHDVETGLATQYQEIITSYQGYLGQIKLKHLQEIYAIQAYRACQKYLGIFPKPVKWNNVFRDNPDKKLEPFDFRVNSTLWEEDNQRANRKEMTRQLNEARIFVGKEKRTLKEQIICEFEAQRRLFLQGYSYYVSDLLNNDAQKIVDFVKSKYFEEIPYVDITNQMWSGLFVSHNNRVIQDGDYTDIEVISTYLPYVDVLCTDSFMCGQIKQHKLDEKYKTKVFAANKTGLKDYEKYLERSLIRKKPVNWPKTSIFVLSDDGIKKDSWEFFRELGNQSRGDQKGNGWAEIYAFDDGNMPKYHHEGIKIPIPFTGLQDVKTIKLTDEYKSRPEIINLCKKNCRTAKFVLIDSYRKLPEDFVKKAIDYCREDKNQILNYQIISR